LLLHQAIFYCIVALRNSHKQLVAASAPLQLGSPQAAWSAKRSSVPGQNQGVAFGYVVACVCLPHAYEPKFCAWARFLLHACKARCLKVH